MRTPVKIIALVCIMILAGAGCTTITKTGVLKPDPMMKGYSINGARFSLIVNGSNWTYKAKKYYPDLFEDDFTSVPIYIAYNCDSTHEMIAGPDPITGATGVLISFLFPFPMDYDSTSCKGSLRLPGSEGWLIQKRVNFGHVDTNFFSINPVYWIMMPFFNESEKDMGPFEEQTIVQAAFQAITGADARKLSDYYEDRKARLGTVNIYGHTYWYFVSLHKSGKKASANSGGNDGEFFESFFSMLLSANSGGNNGSKFDTATIGFWEKKPSLVDAFDESVTVAKKDGSTWKTWSAYLRRLALPKPTLATVVLKNGRPAGIRITENAMPRVDDLVYLDNENDPADIRWNNSMLIEAKNTTLPQLLRSGNRAKFMELINRIEKEVLHLNELAQMADSKANQIVLKNGDPQRQNTLAVLYRQRITIFKAILSALKRAGSM